MLGYRSARTHIYGKIGLLKTTVEIPDDLFRQAKATAAQQGTSLKDFLTEAVREQLRKRTSAPNLNKPWMRAFGGVRDLHRETKRLERVIQREFERIDEGE
jgi:hypothetical protein